MNHEFIQRMALATAIRAAKVSHRPLGVWPGDAAVLQLDDLPTVSKEYIEEHPPTGSVTVGRGEGVDFTVGMRYGVIMQSFTVGEGLVSTVGVWK